jgi:DNA-binding NtrC family response regulator
MAGELKCPVLLVGEAGTGKQTLACLIHTVGSKREQSFAAVDCARLPFVAVAFVLFGDPGATQRRQLGSIYLAQPQRLPRELQQALAARLVENPDALPRILAGCERDPVAEIAAGRLLEELYHALTMVRLDVPPLRERLADLPWLAERFLVRAGAETGSIVTGLTADAWEVLRQHSWPGNLAELFDVLAAARRRATGECITAADLPAALRLRQRLDQTPGPEQQKVLPLDQVLEEVERRLIELTLRRTRGNKTQAAQLLGVWRPRLLRRLEALGLLDSTPEQPAE